MTSANHFQLSIKNIFKTTPLSCKLLPLVCSDEICMLGQRHPNPKVHQRCCHTMSLRVALATSLVHLTEVDKLCVMCPIEDEDAHIQQTIEPLGMGPSDLFLKRFFLSGVSAWYHSVCHCADNCLATLPVAMCLLLTARHQTRGVVL